MNKKILFFKRIARNLVLNLNKLFDIVYLFMPVKRAKDSVIILEYAGIGDFLFNAVFVDKYIKYFSKKEATLIVSELVYPIAVFFFDRYDNVAIIGINLRKFEYNFLYRCKLSYFLGKQELLYCIHPTFAEPNLYIYNKLFSENYIRYEGEPFFYPLLQSKVKNEKVIPNRYKNTNVNILNHHLQIYNHITESDTNISSIDTEIENFFSSYLYPKPTMKLPKKYIVILTDGSVPERKFSTKQWQSLLDILPKEIAVVQLGKNVLSLNHKNLINLINKTTLIESMSIIKNADIAIGNETGLTHFAYLNRVFTVVILGGGHYGRFLPLPFDFHVTPVIFNMDCFECGWHCDKIDGSDLKQYPCIENISINNIIKVLEVKGFFK